MGWCIIRRFIVVVLCVAWPVTVVWGASGLVDSTIWKMKIQGCIKPLGDTMTLTFNESWSMLN